MRRREFCVATAASAILAGTKARAQAPAAPLRELFADDSGNHVAIGPFHEFGPGNFLFDYPRNRAGRLKPVTDGYDLAPTFDGTGDPLAHLELTGAELRYVGTTYRRIRVERHAFWVRNGRFTLWGDMAWRSGYRPKAAIVLVYGSGDGPREGLDFWASHFLTQGLAVFTYDKRGSGRSSGDWRNASFENLAVDLGAVVREARGTPMLEGLQLGVWGGSQAGWIMPQVAARGGVDFIVMHMGGVTKPGQQVVDMVGAELKAYGFPADEIARAQAYYALDIDVSCGRATFSAIEKAYAAASDAKAEWLLAPPAPMGSSDRTFIRLVADFDVAPYWRASRAPLLAIFGGKDVIVPPDKNAALLKTMLPQGVDAEIAILPNANHLGMIADTGVRAEYPKRTAIDPDYFPRIDRWLERRI